MLELKFRNMPYVLFTVIAGILTAYGLSFVSISQIDIPIPLLITGIFAISLIINLITYAKATTAQLIQLTIAVFFANTSIFAAVLYILQFLKHSPFSIDSNFIISANPLILASSLIFGHIAIINCAKLEEHTENQKQTEQTNHKKMVSESEEDKAVPLSEGKEEKIIQTEIKKEVTDFRIFDKKPEPKTEEPAVLKYEELYPQAKTEQKPPVEAKQEEVFIELENLPSMDLKQEFISEEKQEKKQNKLEKETSPEEEYFDFIPTDIRLVEAPVNKDKETKGKIASIGKLLVNNRDIEGVIESAAERGNEGKTDIFSSNSGEEIYEKFSKLKQEFASIKELALINKGGFTLANNFEDEKTANIAGALIAGIYHTLQNYISQISFKEPLKIFFETENCNSLIIKTADEFLFSNWDKDFKHIESDLPENFYESNIAPYIELGQIINFARFDEAGSLIPAGTEIPNSNKLAAISSALFENIKVFLMNLNLSKLNQITVFSDEEILVIKKVDNETISYTAPIDGLIKLSENFAKIDQLY